MRQDVSDVGLSIQLTRGLIFQFPKLSGTIFNMTEEAEYSTEQQAIITTACEWARDNKKQIAKELTDKNIYQSDTNPAAFFMAGCPAAGKTELAKSFAKFVGEKFNDNGEPIMRIDADDLRELLPGYTGENSRLFQYPASILVDAAFDMIMKNKQSFILDGTLSDLNKARQNISRCLNKKREYMVTVMYVYNDPIEAWKAAQLREVTEGRSVPMDIFIDRYFKSKVNTQKLKDEFGQNIEIDILFKETNVTRVRPEFNVSNIDSYIPDNYNPDSLRETLIKLEEI